MAQGDFLDAEIAILIQVNCLIIYFIQVKTDIIMIIILAVSSIHSNFSQTHQAHIYEPGTGAAFMAQNGWHMRDEYGKSRAVDVAGLPLSAAPILSGVGAGAIRGGPTNLKRTSTLPAHKIKFSQSPE